MTELADVVFQRPVFIALAVTGAILVTAASFMKARLSEGGFRLLYRGGYALTALSVLVFIGAGFLQD